MDLEELARAVAAAAAIQEQEQQHDGDPQHGDEVYLMSSKTVFTYVLRWWSQFVKHVILKLALLFC